MLHTGPVMAPSLSSFMTLKMSFYFFFPPINFFICPFRLINSCPTFLTGLLGNSNSDIFKLNCVLIDSFQWGDYSRNSSDYCFFPQDFENTKTFSLFYLSVFEESRVPRMTENGQPGPFAYLHNEQISVLSMEEVVSLSLHPRAREKYNDYMSALCRCLAVLENWLVHLFIRLSMKVGWAVWMKWSTELDSGPWRDSSTKPACDVG